MKNTLEIQSGKNSIRQMNFPSVARVIVEKYLHIGLKIRTQLLYQKTNIFWRRNLWKGSLKKLPKGTISRIHYGKKSFVDRATPCFAEKKLVQQSTGCVWDMTDLRDA